MKTALQKAQEEYKQRLNDPSYVAPDILRSKNRKRVPESPEPSAEEIKNWKELQDEYFLSPNEAEVELRKSVEEENAAIDNENQIILANEIDDEINQDEDNYLVKIEMMKRKLRGDL